MIEYYQVPIFVYSIENWESKKSLVLEKLEKYKKDSHRSDGKNYEGTDVQTDYFLNKGVKFPPYANELLEVVKPCIEQFKQDANLSWCKYEIDGLWYELAKRNEFHGKHDHGNYGISCVWYVDMNESQKPTEFICEYGLSTLTPQAKEGDIVFFPAWIKHRGGENPTDQDRVIISFNMRRSGRQYKDQYFYDGASVHV